ncbi:MAG: hypothetical protein K2X86_02735 [Cytophagaceae bacterium]|nr:hypothetical protein [Cytophagaceae bacterium]
MERSPENMYTELQRIELELENLLSDENISSEKADFYKALRTVISLKTDSEELNYKFEEIHKVFTAIAIGDFTQRIDVPNRKNIFSHLGTSINAIVEELKVNVVKKQYLEASLEYIPHIAIITDKEGTIKFANSLTYKILGKTKEYILKLRIANIFESQTQFGILNPKSNSFEDITVKITYFDRSFNVSLSVKEIYNKLDQKDGYLYIAKLL